MCQNRFFRSAVVGVICAIAFGVVAFALAHFFDAVIVYAAPGITFLPLVPTKLAYWLDPDGGPAVGVFLLVVCALLFWTILFGAAHFGWVSLKLRRKAQRAAAHDGGRRTS